MTLQGHRVRKSKYAYHYQRADGQRVFRYDNAPHYPDLPGFPKHKHEDERVVPAPAPDLSKVLREIDGYLYPSGRAGDSARCYRTNPQSEHPRSPCPCVTHD